MQITEVRIKLMDDPSERLKAFCSITIDNCFVIRDLKIIDGANGPFVAMPSRKLAAHCPRCACKNHLRAAYCNQCGLKLPGGKSMCDDEGRAKLYADIAHPINSACREMVQASVMDAFEQELERAKQPDYRSRYDDLDLDYAEEAEEIEKRPQTARRLDAAERPPAAAHLPPAESNVPPAMHRLDDRAASQERTDHLPGPHAAEAQKTTARKSRGDFGAGIF